MAFLGLMTVKERNAELAAYSDLIARRADQALRDSETIGRLQREKAALLSELATLKSARERQLANLAKGSAASAAKRKAKAGEVVS
ncbi:hypothetical protein [Sphingobium abikonense]|uniref:hypothetical protein n=1 Tax=Sphingobium abikonense TaxID=86193 RepID=UPI0035111AD4